MSKKILAKILTYLGAIPFIFFTYLIIIKQNYFFAISVKSLLLGYSVVILSFISGIYFAYAILKNQYSLSLLLISNIIALTAWCTIFIKYQSALIILLTCYIIGILIDYICYKKSIIKKWFFMLRLKITFIVVLCILSNLFFLHYF